MKHGFVGIVERIGSKLEKRSFAQLATAVCLLAAGTAIAEPVLSFVRDTPYCYVSTTGRVSTTAFTVELWFKQTSFDSENQIFTQDNSGTGRIFLYTRNGKPYFQVSSNGLTGNTNLTASTWYHFACVRDASGYGTIYIDGQPVTSSTYLNKDTPPVVTVTIGLLLRVKSGFRGDISDVRVWNVARSQTEIQTAMCNRLTGAESGLVHYWPFNEGTGATVSDRAGNADGTIVGATWGDSTDFPLASSSGSWTSPVSGNWSDTANWLDGASAQGVNVAAFFTNNPPTSITVNNDMSGLALRNLTVNGTNGITFTGNTLAFTNASISSQIATTNGDHAFELPILTAAQELLVETATPGALTFSGVIGGTGSLSVNPADSNGGTVTLTGTNTYTGPTALGCGTLSVATLADGGQPCAIGSASSDSANLILGGGTFRYTGPSNAVDRGFTVNPGSTKAALLRVDNDLTVSGQINNSGGALIKTGPGTLRYTLAHAASTIGANQSNSLSTQAPYPDNGDAPANGFGCFTIADGKVVLGAPGQTNYFNGEVTVGAYTTSQAGEETTGELEFIDGHSVFNSYLDIGYYNGTTLTAPTSMQPTITVSGGTITAAGLIISFGYNYFGTNYPNTHGVLNIAGGTLTVTGDFRFGDQPGSDMLATINVYTGALVHTSTSVGMGSNRGGNNALNLYGGLVDEYADIKMGASGSTSRVSLCGGVLRVRNITADTGSEYLIFNGGTLQPRTTGYTLSGLTVATVSTNGAVVDTSLASYTIAQDLLTDPDLNGAKDGGLVKLGTNTLTWVSTNSTFIGDTVVSNGTLRMLADLPAASALVVAPDGEVLVGGNATQTLAAASLTLLDGGTLGFACQTDGSANDRLTVASTPDFGTGCVALYLEDGMLPFTRNGTYTLLTYSGAVPDVSGLTCANAVYGKTYAFAAANGNVTVTIATATATASVWKTDGSGEWSDTGNWIVAPASGSAVRFDNAITGPATVTVASQTAGDIFFNNANAYTLAGSGLTLGDGAAIAVENGAHAIGAPLSLAGNAAVSLAPDTALSLGTVSGDGTLGVAGDGTLVLTAAPDVGALAFDVPTLAFSNSLTITPPIALGQDTTLSPAPNTSVTLAAAVSGAAALLKTGSSTLTLAAINTYSGATTISGGTLHVSDLADGGQPSAIGSSAYDAANLRLGPATFLYDGVSNAVQRGITLQAGSGRAAVVRVAADSDIAFSGWINSASGGFVKTGPGTLRFTGNANNKLASDSYNDGLLNIGANGDGPSTGYYSCGIAEGRLVLGAPFQTNTLGGRLCVGLYTTTAAGAETAGELELADGMLRVGTLAVGRSNGTSTTAPDGVTSRLIVSGGVLTNANYISLGYNGGLSLSGYNARPAMDMSGGFVSVANFYISESSGAKSTVTLRGGKIIASGTARFAMAADTEVVFTLDGDARFETPSSVSVSLPYANSTTARATLRLNGGILSTRTIAKSASGIGTVVFNGGTLQPNASGQTFQSMTAAYVSTNGAVIDTSLAAYTVAQNLLTDPDLGGATDGGLVKLGTNSLSLTSAANTFNGPVRVHEGLLCARLGGTNDLFVATNATFDALGERCTVGDLTGEGLLTNGVIAVTGRLDAGTNGAPAGAAMTVEKLSLLGGSTFACDWSTNSLGQATNDFAAVTGTLTPEGAGTFDFGHTSDDPIPVPFSCTVMSYGSLGGSFVGWKAINTGIPAGKHIATVVTAANGYVTLEIRYGGMLVVIE